MILKELIKVHLHKLVFDLFYEVKKYSVLPKDDLFKLGSESLDYYESKEYDNYLMDKDVYYTYLQKGMPKYITKLVSVKGLTNDKSVTYDISCIYTKVKLSPIDFIINIDGTITFVFMYENQLMQFDIDLNDDNKFIKLV